MRSSVPSIELSENHRRSIRAKELSSRVLLLRRSARRFSILLCEEASSLGRICESLERQLGWVHRRMNVVERKNRLLPYLARRGELIAFDSMALTPPRVAGFIACLEECIPLWIACRSDQPKKSVPSGNIFTNLNASSWDHFRQRRPPRFSSPQSALIKCRNYRAITFHNCIDSRKGTRACSKN